MHQFYIYMYYLRVTLGSIADSCVVFLLFFVKIGANWRTGFESASVISPTIRVAAKELKEAK